jgi:rRNA maturation endonuclease Nob1
MKCGECGSVFMNYGESEGDFCDVCGSQAMKRTCPDCGDVKEEHYGPKHYEHTEGED